MEYRGYFGPKGPLGIEDVCYIFLGIMIPPLVLSFSAFLIFSPEKIETYFSLIVTIMPIWLISIRQGNFIFKSLDPLRWIFIPMYVMILFSITYFYIGEFDYGIACLLGLVVCLTAFYLVKSDIEKGILS